MLADLWPNEGEKRSQDARWLFGSDDANKACAGAIQCSEARLLAFPVRSAKGCFAWLTCPLILGRLARDAVALPKIPSFKVDQALFAKDGKLVLDNAIVLEDYTLTHANELPKCLAKTLVELFTGDTVWAKVKERLVVVSDEMMTHFAQTACEVAQHIRIDDETGTVAGGALFNQENVPSETLSGTARLDPAGEWTVHQNGKNGTDGRTERRNDKTSELPWLRTAAMTLLCLVSDQPVLNLLPALDPTLRPERVVLAVSSEMRSQARRLEVALKRHGIPTELLPLENAFDLPDLSNRFIDFLAAHEGIDLALNVTGGTKPMAIAAQEAFRMAGKPVFYVSVQSDRLYWLAEESRSLEGRRNDTDESGPWDEMLKTLSDGGVVYYDDLKVRFPQGKTAQRPAQNSSIRSPTRCQRDPPQGRARMLAQRTVCCVMCSTSRRRMPVPR